MICKVIYSCIPPSKWQNGKPNAGHGQGLCSGSYSYLQAAPRLSLKAGSGVTFYWPVNGGFGYRKVFCISFVVPLVVYSFTAPGC